MSIEKREEEKEEIFKMYERADEKQIIGELEGHYLEEFVYYFEVGKEKRRVVGLSWAGIKECAYRLGGIEVESCQIDDKGDHWMVVCKASDKFKCNSRFGVSTQSKKMKLKDGSEVEDDFSLQKCVSKAQRNAIRSLIPELFIKNFVDRYLEEHGKKPKEVVEFKAAPPQKATELTAETVFDVLNGAHLDCNLVAIKVLDSAVVVKPVQYIETLTWTQFNGVLKQLGFTWISDAKESRWTYRSDA
jgi:hypothetical protein